MDHDAITKVMTANGTVPYGTGVTPNPYAQQQAEWKRRREYAGLRQLITAKIESLFEPRFITPPETSELIEAIITASDSRMILEIGTCTAFTSLHMLRAIVGKKDAMVVSVDARPAHDKEWFLSPTIAPWFKFVQGWTPGILDKLSGYIFDVIFIDSDHSIEHCEKELEALIPITRKGSIVLFHDCPERQTPNHPVDVPGPIFKWLHYKVAQGFFRGTVLPTCEQMDCVAEWGPGYDPRCNPSLGVFVRL